MWQNEGPGLQVPAIQVGTHGGTQDKINSSFTICRWDQPHTVSILLEFKNA